MAHFANLNNNIVTQVIVVSNHDILDNDGKENEVVGINFCKSLFGEDTNWKQTSFNSNFRGNYAGIGYTYIENVSTMGVASTDIFIRQKPFNSWSLSTSTASWVSPIGDEPGLTTSQISDGYRYEWDEDAYQLDNTKGWGLVTG